MSWKSVKVKSTEKVITTAMIGVSSGRVIRRKRCHEVAPSSAAASFSDCGMVCRPARSEMATKGMPRQTLAAITDQRAFHGSPRKLIGCEIQPHCISTQEMIENWLSKIHQKASAESTVGTTQGRRTMARKKLFNGRFSLRISASHRPSPNFRIEATKV